MLRKKTDLHYRRSSIQAEGSRMRRCKYCEHKKIIELKDGRGGYLGHGQRCKVMGLESHHRYTILDDHVCDEIKVKKMTGEK